MMASKLQWVLEGANVLVCLLRWTNKSLSRTLMMWYVRLTGHWKKMDEILLVLEQGRMSSTAPEPSPEAEVEEML